MLALLLMLALPVSAVALLYARREYRVRGRLSLFGLFLLCLMLFVPNLLLEYATSYQWPESPLDYLGAFLALTGLALCVSGVIGFRSVPKVFCLEPGQLTRAGPYRWSRNPQYLGWLLFLVGFSLIDWSWWCLAVVLVEAISLHLLILIEEAHLRRTFGESYADFCADVPRYLGWGRLRI